jgi:UDP-2-acetamido-3-amino-2,3-dideoxy-glucuronate N-acetyltransferase
VIDPTAIVDEGAVIGEGTLIWHFAHVMRGVRIGRDCVLGQNVFVGEGVLIGDRVKIQNNVSVYAGVRVENEVFVGPSAVFTNVGRPRSMRPRGGAFDQTLVRRGATIGANSTIICGTTIGCFAMVGAGAVVTRDVPDHALVTGVPAVVTGWVCECGASLALDGGDTAACRDCGLGFARDGDRVRRA